MRRCQTSKANFTIGTVAPTLDVDASSPATKYSALTDGLLALRYMIGVRGDALISGTLGSGATRRTAAAVEAYLRALMP